MQLIIDEFCLILGILNPQPSCDWTTLSVAIGLVAESINHKRSKAMDMRLFWLVDRIRQKQFKVEHIPGMWNIADHFTKPLPKHKVYRFFELIAINLDNEELEPKMKMKTVTFPKRCEKGCVV